MIGPRLTLADLLTAQRIYGGTITPTPAGTTLVGAVMAGAAVDLGPVAA